MDLHCLDLGIARFMEFGVILAIPGTPSLETLHTAAVELCAVWPILNKRLDILGGRLVDENYDEHPRHLICWQSRLLSYTLKDVLPFTNNELDSSTPSVDLQSIFSSPASIKDLRHPPALSIQAALLKDACLLGFYIQHPLCDAKGLDQIINAYSSILAGKTVDPLPSRCSIVLKSDATPPSRCNEQLSTRMCPNDFTKLQLRITRVGWGPLILSGAKQVFSCSKQTESRYRIPSFVLNDLKAQAMKDGLNITLNDLLMAWIWKASTASPAWRRNRSDGAQYPSLSFVLNIRRQIEHDVDLHNPWVIIQVPSPTLRPATATDSESQTLIRLAVHVRETIHNARSFSCLRDIIEHHRNARGQPMLLDTMFLVTSWSQQTSLYQTEFQISKEFKTQPVYVHPFVRMPGLFRKFGMRMENTLITSEDGKGGFWVHGCLEGAVWTEFANILVCTR